MLFANGLALSIGCCWISSSKFSVVAFRITNGDASSVREDNGSETALDGKDSDPEATALRLMRNLAVGAWLLAELSVDVPICGLAFAERLVEKLAAGIVASLVKVLVCSPVVFSDGVANVNSVPVPELLLDTP